MYLKSVFINTAIVFRYAGTKIWVFAILDTFTKNLSLQICHSFRVFLCKIIMSPIALRMAKTLWSFGHSECNRVKLHPFISTVKLVNINSLTTKKQTTKFSSANF